MPVVDCHFYTFTASEATLAAYGFADEAAFHREVDSARRKVLDARWQGTAVRGASARGAGSRHLKRSYTRRGHLDEDEGTESTSESIATNISTTTPSLTVYDIVTSEPMTVVYKAIARLVHTPP
jgi:hypothetical protein